MTETTVCDDCGDKNVTCDKCPACNLMLCDGCWGWDGSVCCVCYEEDSDNDDDDEWHDQCREWYDDDYDEEA